MRGYLTQAFDEVFAVFGIEGGMVGGIVGPFARVGVFAEVRRGRPRPAESSRPERQVEVGEFELVQIISGLFVELFEVGDGLAVFKLEDILAGTVSELSFLDFKYFAASRWV